MQWQLDMVWKMQFSFYGTHNYSYYRVEGSWYFPQIMGTEIAFCIFSFVRDFLILCVNLALNQTVFLSRLTIYYINEDFECTLLRSRKKLSHLDFKQCM